MASSAAPEARHLTYEQARARVLAAVAPAPPERVSLLEARGRALRRAVVAPHPLPPFDNASMDGYAVRAADCAGATPSAPATLRVAAVIPAGRVAPRALGPGEAMRIMTGAMVPAGADAVVPFEDVERLEPPGGPERVRIPRPARPRENVRAAGADLAAGATALAAGRELSAHDLGLIAALGFPEVEVGPRPRAALLSTGDELLGAGEPLRPGALRDSNLPMLALLLEECGARVVSAARVGDDPDAVAAGLSAALAAADVALTIGGVSAGDFDPVKQSLEAAGGAELWRVAMKPGRPQAFGAPGGKLFFGLPGNPGSVACVFETLVRPALRRWQGFAALDRPHLEVRTAAAFASRPGRTDFVRATLERRGGEWWAAPAGEQISGHLTPQARAHALLIVPEEVERLEPGASARALLLRWPGDPA